VILASAALGVAALAAPAGASPRGTNGQIAYDRTDPATGDQAVFTANPDGSSERLIVPASCCGDFSPDGSKLAVPYLTDDGRVGTATINADGTGYTPFPISDPTLNIGCNTGSWSPDGKRLVCETWDDWNPARNGVYTISSADGSGLTRITSNPLGGHDVPGSYSPNGKRIVFIRYDPDGNPAGMFVVKTNGSQLRQILPASADLTWGFNRTGHHRATRSSSPSMSLPACSARSGWSTPTAAACTRSTSAGSTAAPASRIPTASGATEFAGRRTGRRSSSPRHSGDRREYLHSQRRWNRTHPSDLRRQRRRPRLGNAPTRALETVATKGVHARRVPDEMVMQVAAPYGAVNSSTSRS
jgi:hypothetical protein